MANVLLSAKGIKIRFGGVIAADGIDLDVYEGENLAIIGPNGAGKTTFLNISTGYLRPQAGTVNFLGHDIPRICRAPSPSSASPAPSKFRNCSSNRPSWKTC